MGIFQNCQAYILLCMLGTHYDDKEHNKTYLLKHKVIHNAASNFKRKRRCWYHRTYKMVLGFNKTT